MYRHHLSYALAAVTLLAACSNSPQNPVSQAQPVVAAPAPTLSLTSSASQVALGGTYTLTWTSSNLNFCEASGSWSGTAPVSGSQSFTAPQTAGRYTYTLLCRGPNGERQATASVQVGNPSAPGSNPPTSSGGSTIGPDGGLVVSSNLAELIIPRDAFSANRLVTVSPSGNPAALVKAFDDTVRPLFGNVVMVNQQIIIDIGGQQPEKPLQLKITVPDGVAALAPSQLYDLRVFTRNYQAGAHAPRYPVEPTSPLYPANSTTLNVVLPPEAFTLNWNPSAGTHRAVVYLGLTQTGRDASLGDRRTISAQRPGVCQGSSLQNPFATARSASQAFGSGIEPGTADTRVFRSGAFIPAPADTAVLALNQGVVEKIGDQFDADSQSGWRRYLVLKTTDGSRVLYSNLGTTLVAEGAMVVGGQPIAQVGADTGSRTPGVNIEYVPNPLVYDSSAKADAAACLGVFEAGSYYLYDDPNINNPELHRIYIDGNLIRTIEAGPTNTLRLGRLRKGKHILISETPNPDNSPWVLKQIPANGYPDIGGSAVREADGVERIRNEFEAP